MNAKLFAATWVVAAAVWATAFPAAAVAVNTPVLTHPTGTTLATGTKFTATNFGTAKIKLSSGVTIECSSSRMTGTLTKNNGTEVEGVIEVLSFEGTAVEGSCTNGASNFKLTVNSASGLPWCFRSTGSMKEDEFQLRGDVCTKAVRPITFIADFGKVECAYQRLGTTPITGTYTTDTEATTGPALLQIPRAVEGSKFTGETGNPLSCPASFELEVMYLLETDTITPAPSLYFS